MNYQEALRRQCWINACAAAMTGKEGAHDDRCYQRAGAALAAYDAAFCSAEAPVAQIKAGDRVRHLEIPEIGVGQVVRVQDDMANVKWLGRPMPQWSPVKNLATEAGMASLNRTMADKFPEAAASAAECGQQQSSTGIKSTDLKGDEWNTHLVGALEQWRASGVTGSAIGSGAIEGYSAGLAEQRKQQQRLADAGLGVEHQHIRPGTRVQLYNGGPDVGIVKTIRWGAALKGRRIEVAWPSHESTEHAENELAVVSNKDNKC